MSEPEPRGEGALAPEVSLVHPQHPPGSVGLRGQTAGGCLGVNVPEQWPHSPTPPPMLTGLPSPLCSRLDVAGMVQPELLGAAAALMLLGAAVSLCVKCQLSATKREMRLSEHRSQLESQQRFEVIRSHSSATRRLEKTKGPENLSIARKTTEQLSASHHAGYGSRDESRYQNFLTEDYLQGDSDYVEPISLDYNSRARFFIRPKEKEEDSYSYENVIIGVSHSFDPVTDEAADYENSEAMHTWKQQQEEALQTESPGEEPVYINTAPASVPALLSKQSILHKV
ncbi:linker for activation of T-cells family member 2 isoform X3 [Chiroxiphia lanceolata]|uniref:linker for activation of T-cells family member 2 isoform X3 n=1 Tax=Chiroxiphia lanceolata TaxID=296741 RepID=UPI0013CEA972|nr:linker for activation of T-cells family member 2 isoform X3 [Chiroxiphia lanceolata]